MDEGSRLPSGVAALVVVLVALSGAAWTLTFPHSPEDWSQLSLLRTRSLFGCMAPFEEYTYYRPVWFAYLKACDLLGLAGGPAHAGPAVMHALGTLLVYGALVRTGRGSACALCVAVLVGLAPGTSGALSWLAAGNKAFTFFFLALGAVILVAGPASRGRVVLAVLLGVLPAIGCSENGYLVAVLYPLLVLAVDRRRWRVALLLFAVGAAVALVHLKVLSPQTKAAVADDRLGQLLTLIGSDPLHWILVVCGNLGRYFAHGLGVADDAPRAGMIALGAVLVTCATLAVRRRRFVRPLVALAIFVVLNVPASLFEGEVSRHQAYLPALGAGLVLGELLLALPYRSALVVVAALWFAVGGYLAKRPWSEHLRHTERVRQSALTALPELPAHGRVVLVNVPVEYHAAFHLRFGGATDVTKWPSFTILTTRRTVFLPNGTTPPPTGDTVVLEYDGTAIVRSSLEAIGARARAPDAWFLDGIDAFANADLAWSEIVGSPRPLAETGLGFTASVERATAGGAARSVRVMRHVSAGSPVVWEVEVDAGRAGWLVLAWNRLDLPILEHAGINLLRPLPWLFEVRVRELDAPHRTLRPPIQPVLGFLPAVWLERGEHRLHVELAVRLR